MTKSRPRLAEILLATLAGALMVGGSLAAAEPEPAAPAGQVCPPGSYVTGFDARANIICSGTCGNGVLNTGEACDDGNTAAGDGCSPICQSEGAAAAAAATVVAAETIPAAPATGPATAPATLPATLPAIAVLAIEAVKPWSVAYGTRETDITISGTGFNADTVVLFQGKSYVPAINAEGTELNATIPTRNLAMGAYAITVSNGPEMQTTRKKALVVY